MLTAETLSIPRRFNGPLHSGNGGYSSGIVAGLLGGTAEVTLRRPVPLDTDLDIERCADGSVRLIDGCAVIAEGRETDGFELEVPDPVTIEEARAASERHVAPSDGLFSRCFVCGLAREDAFGVTAGMVDGRDVAATPWTPPAWTADHDGHVRPEFVWAALDCPTYFALYPDGSMPLSFLARMTARIGAPIVAGREHVVMAWPVEIDGRKHHAGAAVVSAEGEVLAVAKALLIAPRP